MQEAEELGAEARSDRSSFPRPNSCPPGKKRSRRSGAVIPRLRPDPPLPSPL